MKASTLDTLAKEYPNLDKSKFGYEVLTPEELLSSYAAAIIEFVGTFPLINELASSGTLLTSESVLACKVDEYPNLENAIAYLGQDEELESEDEEAEATEVDEGDDIAEKVPSEASRGKRGEVKKEGTAEQEKTVD